jgi:hypothetical protein
MGFALRCSAITSLALCGCGSGEAALVVRTVSEYGGTPIAGVKVQVGDQPWVTTASNGEARFAGAAPPYAVRVHRPMTYTDYKGGAHQHDKVWQLIGQSGNPLILDVDGTVAQMYRATISGSIAGRSGSARAQARVWTPTDGGMGAADGTFQTQVLWEASPTYSFLLRALESDAAAPPAHYTDTLRAG